MQEGSLRMCHLPGSLRQVVNIWSGDDIQGQGCQQYEREVLLRHIYDIVMTRIMRMLQQDSDDPIQAATSLSSPSNTCAQMI